MKIQSERPERHISKIRLYMMSTTHGLKYYTLAPPRSYDCGDGKTVCLEPHEQGAIRIEFTDTHELDELIGVLTKFRDQVGRSLGYWV